LDLERVAAILAPHLLGLLLKQSDFGYPAGADLAT
jgi:hypothetical protein